MNSTPGYVQAPQKVAQLLLALPAMQERIALRTEASTRQRVPVRVASCTRMKRVCISMPLATLAHVSAARYAPRHVGSCVRNSMYMLKIITRPGIDMTGSAGARAPQYDPDS